MRTIPRNINIVILDSINHFACEIEDRVLVWLDRFGGVNYKSERRVENLK